MLTTSVLLHAQAFDTTLHVCDASYACRLGGVHVLAVLAVRDFHYGVCSHFTRAHTLVPVMS